MAYKPDQSDFIIQVVVPGDPAPGPSCSKTALFSAVGSNPANPTIQILSTSEVLSCGITQDHAPELLNGFSHFSQWQR